MTLLVLVLQDKGIMDTQQLYTENFSHMSPTWSRIFNFVAERAEGSYIYTTDGRRLLDFTCGIGVTNTGHCHPNEGGESQNR